MMIEPDDDPVSALARTLSAEPPLPEEVEAAIWRGTQTKIAAGVVVASSVAVATSAARAASAASSAPAAGALSISAVVATTAGKIVVIGALALGVVVGVVVGGVGEQRLASRTPVPVSTPAPIVVDPPPAPGVTAPAPGVVDAAAPTGQALRPAGVDERSRPSSMAAAPPTTEPGAVASGVSKEELLAVDAGRAALQRNDARAALEAVARQRALPLPHALDAEAAGIEVLATALEDPQKAAGLARAFLARWPDSPMAPRVRHAVPTDSDHGSAP